MKDLFMCGSQSHNYTIMAVNVFMDIYLAEQAGRLQ